MAIKLSNGDIFLHNPRTGGTFVTAVLRKCGVHAGGVGEKHDCPGVVPMDMTVPHHVFVRHPYKWIKSVWAIQHDWGWPRYPKYDYRWWHPFTEINDPPDEAKDDFEAFLYWIANSRRGFVTSIFFKFADWPNSQVYDTDCMDTHLPLMLQRIGVLKAKAKQAIEDVEASKKPRNDFPLPPDASAQARAVFANAEHTCFRRFGYGEEEIGPE